MHRISCFDGSPEVPNRRVDRGGSSVAERQARAGPVGPPVAAGGAFSNFQKASRNFGKLPPGLQKSSENCNFLQIPSENIGRKRRIVKDLRFLTPY
jgi:hypothetical protein